VATVGEPWADFPGSASDEENARRLNAFIEVEVLKSPEQYYWLHKRFKTRPPGEQRFY
jgi:KDO2-lipid IV(A) lauroyltransferase